MMYIFLFTNIDTTIKYRYSIYRYLTQCTKPIFQYYESIIISYTDKDILDNFENIGKLKNFDNITILYINI